MTEVIESMALAPRKGGGAGPIIELHISNIHKRESMYHNSYVSKVATAIIAGLGAKGYSAAVRAMRELIQ